MATTVLPPIPPVGTGLLTQKVLESIPRDKTHDTWHKPVKKHTDRNNSAAGVPIVCHKNELRDASKYRNTFYHNLCIEMLKDGFHLAFRDLFNLVRSEKEIQAENADYAEDNIEESEEKLEYIKSQLIVAEIASRQGHSEKIYESQHALSQFFEQIGNFRLADHFYTEAFNTSKQIRGDGRRKEAEANFNLGTSAERKSDYLLAQKLYEEYFALTTDRDWKSEDGFLLHNHARDCLTNMFITLSEQVPSDKEAEVLLFLHKAYDLVKGCDDDDSSYVSNVGYLLGCKYDSYGKHDQSIEYLTKYLELCKSHNDNVGVGRAYQALAYAYQRQGNMDKAADNLKTFLSVMENCGDKDTLCSACSDLGALYNYIGKYEQSANYYKRAFKMSQDKNNFNNIELSRCEYGMALAHGLLNGEVDKISKSSRANIDFLLNWKSERVQSFTDDVQTYFMYPTRPISLQGDQVDNIVETTSETSDPEAKSAAGDS